MVLLIRGLSQNSDYVELLPGGSGYYHEPGEGGAHHQEIDGMKSVFSTRLGWVSMRGCLYHHRVLRLAI
jgi:hypothetical protein